MQQRARGENGILLGMSQTGFFIENSLPVFDFLSAESKRALEAYIAGGNSAFRARRVLEFFKAIDWLPAGEGCDLRPLHKLAPALQRRIAREISDYRLQKAQQRAQNSEKREEYRLRVFEYFRAKMPRHDKMLLESLRDYELDLTGRDVNFRHHFPFDSFKKVDAFIQADSRERQRLFAAFKKDVDTYKRNYDKLHNPPPPGGHGFSFDDWCDLNGESTFHQAGGQARKPHASQPANPVYQAYRTLRLDWGAPADAVKRQFRRLTLEYHPDLPTGSEEKMKSLLAAYQEIQRFWQQSGQIG